MRDGLVVHTFEETCPVVLLVTARGGGGGRDKSGDGANSDGEGKFQQVFTIQ